MGYDLCALSQRRRADVGIFQRPANRDPLKQVAEGRFREDLFYRLHVIPILLPALRERKEDILPIARHFLLRFAAEEGKAFRGIAPEAEETLVAYDWPGNVRQLQNVLRNVVVLHNGHQVTPDMLPSALSTGPGSEKKDANTARTVQVIAPDRGAHASVKPLWLVEKEAIEDAIQHCGGNIPPDYQRNSAHP